MPQGYDIALVCLNGHIINSAARTYPQLNKKFCDKCGARTIFKCPRCENEIQGEYESEEYVGLDPAFQAPAFCHNCGNPLPWTETKIGAARELAQELDLSSEDKEMLTKSIDDIVSDSPRTTLGATRYKKILAKVSKEGASALRTILIDIVSETAKRTIWPG